MKSPLKLFGDVRPGEATTALLLALDVFLILTAYYLLKVAREPLILLGGGAEVKSYASFGQTVLLVLVANAYGWLAARTSRIKLIAFVTLFFLGNLLLFWALGAKGTPIGVPFFLWVGVFNIVTITQFWSFAADTYGEEQGKRLFPIVGIGSSVGAVGGAWLAAPLIRGGSPYLLMVVAAGILVASLLLTVGIHFREANRRSASGTVREPVAPGNAFGLVLRDRYLLVFAALMLVINYVTRSGDYVLDRMILEHAPLHGRTAYIGELKAHYFEWINVISVVMQLFVVSRVIKYLGVRAALVLVPMASLAGYGTATVTPMLAVVLAGRVAESSLEYSLSNTTQQTLWLATSREAKYKAKQVIDSFCRRGGDALSAAVVWLGARFALGTRVFLAVNVGLTLVWIGLAWRMGRDFAARTAEPREPQRQRPRLIPQFVYRGARSVAKETCQVALGNNPNTSH